MDSISAATEEENNRGKKTLPLRIKSKTSFDSFRSYHQVKVTETNTIISYFYILY